MTLNGTYSTTGGAIKLIVAQNNKFTPRETVVQVGDWVRWFWTVSSYFLSHNLGRKCLQCCSIFRCYLFSLGWSGFSERKCIRRGSGNVFSAYFNKKFVHQFNLPGTYYYVCENHASAGMIGWVIVTQAEYSSSSNIVIVD